jgi:hypothetical protein
MVNQSGLRHSWLRVPTPMGCPLSWPSNVQQFIAAGVDVNAPFGHTTPLIRAISARYPDIVAVLIRAGADIHQVAPDGTRPIDAIGKPGRANATAAEQERLLHALSAAAAQAKP